VILLNDSSCDLSLNYCPITYSQRLECYLRPHFEESSYLFCHNYWTNDSSPKDVSVIVNYWLVDPILKRWDSLSTNCLTTERFDHWLEESGHQLSDKRSHCFVLREYINRYRYVPQNGRCAHLSTHQTYDIQTSKLLQSLHRSLNLIVIRWLSLISSPLTNTNVNYNQI